MTSHELKAARHAATPRLRDKIILRLNRRLPDGQKVRVVRKSYADCRFALHDASGNILKEIPTPRDLVTFAVSLNAL